MWFGKFISKEMKQVNADILVFVSSSCLQVHQPFQVNAFPISDVPPVWSRVKAAKQAAFMLFSFQW